MTTCRYCRREYSQPPAECLGCGAPLPMWAIGGGAWDWQRHYNAVLNAQLDAINAASLPDFNPNHMGLGAHYGYGDSLLGERLGNRRDW